jgi:hypothetical protein
MPEKPASYFGKSTALLHCLFVLALALVLSQQWRNGGRGASDASAEDVLLANADGPSQPNPARCAPLTLRASHPDPTKEPNATQETGKAVSLAADNLIDKVPEAQVRATSEAEGNVRKQQFSAPGLSDTVAHFSWFPIDTKPARLNVDAVRMRTCRQPTRTLRASMHLQKLSTCSFGSTIITSIFERLNSGKRDSVIAHSAA